MLTSSPKHFSNTNESLKFIDEIIVPHIQSERERTKLQIQNDHTALLFIDVFSVQITSAVLHKLWENYIVLVRVPPNMTNLFQPLDLRVSSAAKAFMKRRSLSGTARKSGNGLNLGKSWMILISNLCWPFLSLYIQVGLLR